MGLNPEIHLALESTFQTTSVLFGQKTLGGRSRLPFIMDQSLPECLAPSRPLIPVCLKRDQALSVSEDTVHCGGRKRGMALFHLPWALKPSLLLKGSFNCLLYLPCHLYSSLARLSPISGHVHTCGPFPHCNLTVNLAFLIFMSTNNCTSSSYTFAFGCFSGHLNIFKEVIMKH